ncbi:phosphoribosylformylglycinamidine synthase [Caloranaerobacter sp. TR13]|uniref:phosphoribosylformylglycinamidine synthase subunit PurL n=1 Tax=Caloranaerobacter sp. TR13 TaxID=1302151 RepID=UPI0006D3B718|nr:phosphoribosylformylglycinamidine synthase subunit PurL [Caloranaerobacter sp. TR13]KPU27049.1 phosphoribosylformylglycinamidine synthase [Caloranaerobacter sp. TR13]
MNNKPWKSVGLTKEEYNRILETLGREPNILELNMYGVMWSEHCSYKNSRALFKHFPTSNERVLQGPGENAGIIDIGDNKAIAMKIESHNHPSAVEPYQGAATGVGGIIRDIFAMGARPIALLNSLRFGEIEEDDWMRYLFSGVVSGIGGYGNCIGIPTVGGEVYFNKSYKGNPLVNAMCIGVIEHDKIHRGTAAGAGNLVMYVGASTGRDGIGGASFASVELTEETAEQRSAVQVGDPFMEKLLLEACLELLDTDYVVGIQDLGAAGLTSACSEMASRGNSGMIVDVSLVPRREEGMLPVEVMISESQERMLLVIKKGAEEKVKKIFDKWGLHSAVIGEVTDDGMLTIMENGKIVGRVPAKSLADDAPKYYREYKKPEYIDQKRVLLVDELKEVNDLNEVLFKMLSSTNLCSREWVYNQYDYQVRTSTVVTPGADAAVVRIDGTNKAIAATTDCNSRYCYLNPRRGAQIAVAEAARNIVVTGGKPLAVTDGLNFGNPEKPDRFWQFRESILGISEACKKFNTPVVSGNVSFYNETPENAIYPTPIIGMVGLIEDLDKVMTIGFKDEGDIIVLLGLTKGEIGASEYLKVIHGLELGEVPEIDLDLEKRLQDLCLEIIDKKLIKSAHDLSDGGLALALCECCSKGNLGAEISVNTGLREDIYLFSESQSRILISLDVNNVDELKELCNQYEIPFTVLGKTIKDKLSININGKSVIDIKVEDITNKLRSVLPCIMG